MPLSDNRRLVPDLLQQLGKRLLRTIEAISISHEAVQVAVFPRLNNGSAGAADGIRAKAVGEQHALVGNSIQIWCCVDPGAVAAHGVSCMVVGEDEHDVWP